MTAEDIASAQSCFFPFSSGPYNCARKNPTMLEIIVIIARTLYCIDLRPLPGDTLGEGAPELFGEEGGLRNGSIVQFNKREA